MIETAPLERETVERLVEEMRKRIAGQMGITLQEDHNGAWGPAGTRYLTVRFGDPADPGDLIEVQMRVIRVSSSNADRAEYEYQHEDK